MMQTQNKLEPQEMIYPYELNRVAVAALIPHRGEIFFVKALRLLSPQRFIGTAQWDHEQAGLAGHFPGLPIIPAVFIVEAAAQIAGAGLCASSQAQTSPEQIGVLAAIRRCNFMRPAFPGEELEFELEAQRPMAGFRGMIGKVHRCSASSCEKIANLDFVIAQAPRSHFSEFITNY